jgi:two-component system chemotaxis response regulator CheY
MKILLVDKFSTMRRILKNILNQLGHTEIIEAENEERAFNLIVNDPVDLIFLDWKLPVKRGMDFFDSIKTNDRLKYIPVFAVSDIIQRDHMISAINAGAADFISKPYSQKIIKQKIEFYFAER